MANARRHSRRSALAVIATGLAASVLACASSEEKLSPVTPPADTAPGPVSLPPPALDGATAVERALNARRSRREYSQGALQVSELAQVLWAAQGVTQPATGFRAAPSAGALYPLEVYVAVGNVAGLTAGVYKYEPQGHQLRRVCAGDRRAELSGAGLNQSPIKAAAAVLVLAAVYGRTKAKYGERGVRYAHLEAGHAAQNVYLQAFCLGLGTVAIGAFDDQAVATIAALAADEEPLYLMPVGRL